MTVKESGTAILLETNVKTSVDKFLPISQNANVEPTREGMGKSYLDCVSAVLKAVIDALSPVAIRFCCSKRLKSVLYVTICNVVLKSL